MHRHDSSLCRAVVAAIIEELDWKYRRRWRDTKQYKFSVEDIKKLTGNMVILVDSRKKQNVHILDYLKKQGIPYQVTKLDYGDYSFMIPASAAGGDIYFHRDCVVERKGSLEELSGNLAQNRERFEAEFLWAGNDGCKVYLMVEAPGGLL